MTAELYKRQPEHAQPKGQKPQLAEAIIASQPIIADVNADTLPTTPPTGLGKPRMPARARRVDKH